MRSIQVARSHHLLQRVARRFYSKEQQTQDHKHCVELVQSRDMEGYLCGLLMPSASRQAYFALRAFNVEIANIKDASRSMGRSRANTDNDDEFITADSSLASRLRIQWWKDGVSEVFGGNVDNESSSATASDHILQSLTSSRKQNPVMRSLAHAIRDHNLTHRFLSRMIEARENDLDVLQYEKLTDVAQYGEDTVSSLLYLSLETVGVRDEASDMVASDIGVSLGLITALRSTTFRAMQGESSIPVDLSNKYSVSMETIYNAGNAHSDKVSNQEESLDAQQALRGATKEIAQMARFHIHRARGKRSVVPSKARQCLLPAVCGLHYLDVLHEYDYDVFHPSLMDTRRFNLMLLLVRAWLTGSY